MALELFRWPGRGEGERVTTYSLHTRNTTQLYMPSLELAGNTHVKALINIQSLLAGTVCILAKLSKQLKTKPIDYKHCYIAGIYYTGYVERQYA